MKIFLWFILIAGAFLGISLMRDYESSVDHPERINGVSLVNPHEPIDSIDMAGVRRINSIWVALIPFGFSRQNEPEVHYNHDWQWWGERLDGCAELIELARKNDLKVMVKPHVWMRGGWIGEFDLQEESDWELWEKSYTEFMLAYAALSEQYQVEMLCIGTELKNAVSKRPTYWRELIAKIRKVYSGKLTYAANWDDYRQVAFWDDLDYIGLDAYFPLVTDEKVTVNKLEKSVAKINEVLAQYSKEHERPVLFTEFGYRSARGGAGNHWEIPREAEVDLQVQVDAYESLIQSFWTERWFAGGFLWKWHFRPGVGGPTDSQFTPQGKPVEEVIKKYYENTSLRTP